MPLRVAICHKCDPSTLFISGDQDNVSIKNEGIQMTATHHLSDNQSALMHRMTQRHQWLDEQLYPFQSRFVEIDGSRIHYIGEGSGPILFFLHPSIGWSFMYANIIKELRTQFRCIALDLPGFGPSPAVSGYQHTPTNDSRLIERFIQTLGLTDVTLFAHDITGSICLVVQLVGSSLFRARSLRQKQNEGRTPTHDLFTEIT